MGLGACHSLVVAVHHAELRRHLRVYADGFLADRFQELLALLPTGTQE